MKTLTALLLEQEQKNYIFWMGRMAQAEDMLEADNVPEGARQKLEAKSTNSDIQAMESMTQIMEIVTGKNMPLAGQAKNENLRQIIIDLTFEGKKIQI